MTYAYGFSVRRKKMNCWICGNLAETGEHKIKRSLFTAIYGNGPYKGEESKFHFKDGKIRKLQGPNSNLIKYPNTLCSQCNNQDTQAFDFAFDKFFRYVLDNKEKILKHRVIDFMEIYGKSFLEGQLNLFKYFAKLIGCDISRGGLPVPLDIPNLLSLTAFQTKLKISFAIHENKALLPNHSDCTLGIGTLVTSDRNLKEKDDPSYLWNTYFSYLHVWYWYDVEQHKPYGSEWIGNKRFLYLGTMESDDDIEKEILRPN